MFPWMIEKLVEVMETYQDVDIVGSSRMYKLGSGPLPLGIDNIKGCLYRENEFIKSVCEKGLNFVVTPSVMLRLGSIKKKNLLFRDVGPAFDFYFWLEANGLGLFLYLLDYPLLEYRWHDTSGTSRTDAEQWLLSHEKIVNFIADLNLGFDFEGLRKRFAVALAVEKLSPYIIKLGKREISRREFKEKENDLRTLGLPLPFSRRVRWFLKYVLCKRWLGL
jgi:hypothetical protein